MSTIRSNFLDQAILDGRLSQLKYAFRNDENLSHLRTRNGASPLVLVLHVTDDNLRRKIFNFLLQRGAVLSEKDPKTGKDVLAWACFMGREEQIKKLLEFAPGEFDLRQPDIGGMLTLHHVVRSGNPFSVYHIVKEMRKYSMPIDVANHEGLTPFLEAKRMGYDLISQILVKTGNANPTQFDTKTFRTKTRWSEVGHNEREENDLKQMIGEIKITGSNRPHTAFNWRRENSSRSRRTPASTKISQSACVTVSSPSRIQDYTSRELYSDLHILDLEDVVDGKTSVYDIRKAKRNETDSENNSQQNDSRRLFGQLAKRQPFRLCQTWSKLNTLMSMSDNAAGLTTEGFAHSVPETKSDNNHNDHQHNILSSMMTSLSHQMTNAFMKTAVEPTKPKVIVKKPPPPKPKKGSTLAFIMRTRTNKKPTRRNTATVSFKPMNVIAINSRTNEHAHKATRPTEPFSRSHVAQSNKNNLPIIGVK